VDQVGQVRVAGGALVELAHPPVPVAGNVLDRVNRRHAVVADVHPGQHDLTHAAGDVAIHLCDDLVEGQRGVGPHEGDDAEGAHVVAAVLHLDEGAAAPQPDDAGVVKRGGV